MRCLTSKVLQKEKFLKQWKILRFPKPAAKTTFRSLMLSFLILAKLRNSNRFSRKAKKSTHLITGLSRYRHWFEKVIEKVVHDQKNELHSGKKILCNSQSGFLDQYIQWFRSYLCERMFFIEIENKPSDYRKISCGEAEDSILGPLLFLIYVNDMPQAVKSNLFLYTLYTSCLDIEMSKKLKKQLNKDFENACDWFIDNKLSIHI